MSIVNNNPSQEKKVNQSVEHTIHYNGSNGKTFLPKILIFLNLIDTMIHKNDKYIRLSGPVLISVGILVAVCGVTWRQMILDKEEIEFKKCEGKIQRQTISTKAMKTYH